MKNIKSKFKVVIVGGGVTGFWLAKQLTQMNADWLMVTSDIGGLLGQVQSNGFTFDASGGHVYTTQDPRLSEIMENVGATRLERKAYYMHEGEFVDYPVQDNADRLGIRMPEKGYVPDYKLGMNLRDLVEPAFGTSFVNRWFAPFNERVWTTSINEMDADWTSSRVKLAGPKTNWGPNAEFYYATMGQIFGEVTRHVDMNRVVQDLVVYADLQNKRVHLASGDEIDYDQVVYTPSLKFLAPQLQFSVAHLKQNRIMNVCIGLNRKITEMPDFHWYYTDIQSSRAHRVTKLSNYHPSLTPSPNQDSLMMEFPFLTQSPLTGDPRYDSLKWMPAGSWMRKSRIDAGFAEDLMTECGIQGVDRHDVRTALIVETGGYPIPTKGVRSKIAEIKREAMKFSAFPAGRFGSHAYFNIPDCMTEAEILARLVTRTGDDTQLEMDVHDYLYSSFYYKLYKIGRRPENY